MKYKRIAIDTSKHVFALHGVDEQERPVLRRELKRGQVEAFFSKQEAAEVVRGASGGSHHLGRLLNTLGHRDSPDPAAIRQALCQTDQERPQRCRGNQRGGVTSRHALSHGEDGRSTSRLLSFPSV